MSTVDLITPGSSVLTYHTSTAKEPGRGSIVMTQGLRGTAWQRHAKDGFWHSSTGIVATWEDLFRHHAGASGVKVLLEVPARPEDEPDDVEENRVQITIYAFATERGSYDFDDHLEVTQRKIEKVLKASGLSDVKVMELDVEDSNREDG